MKVSKFTPRSIRILVQIHRKSFSPNRSFEKTTEKDIIWSCTEELTEAYENLKQKLMDFPCLAHYNSNYPKVITARKEWAPHCGKNNRLVIQNRSDLPVDSFPTRNRSAQVLN